MSVCPRLISRLAAKCAAILCMLTAFSAHAEDRKRVLILNPYVRDTEPFASAASAFRSNLAREYAGVLDVYDIPLDLARFASEGSELPLVDFLEERIQEKPVDLVVPIGGASVQFTHRHRTRLFRDVPVLVLAAEPRMIPDGFLDHNANLVCQRLILTNMIEDMLTLRPQTRTIAFVIGSSAIEQAWAAQCRLEFAEFEDRVDFLWLDTLSLDQVLQRCADLPPDSFIFHTLFLVDAMGVSCEKNEALMRLYQVANAPVYSVFSSELGIGPVGGHLMQNVEIGEIAAAHAARILRGEPVDTIESVILEDVVPTYDWRELKRWNIPLSRLPANAVIRYQQPGFWERYRWRAVGLFVFMILQALLIGFLLVNRKRRIHAEAEANLIAEISAKFVNLPASEIDREILDAERRVCELLKLDVAGLWQWSNHDNPILRLTHLHGEVKIPPPEVMDSAEYFPWFRESMIEGRIVGFTSLKELPSEAARDCETFRTFGIRSCITIPLSVGGEPPIGALALNTTRSERKWPDHQIARLQMVAQVFTNALARKRADQALAESEMRLTLAADAALAGIWVLDWDTGTYWINDRIRAIFGYDADQPLTLDEFKKSVHPHDLDRLEKSIEEMIGSGEPHSIEYRGVRTDGTGVWIASHGRPIFRPDGSLERLIGISMDISQRRTAESEALDLRVELAHAGRVTLLGQLASALAHELSQPLSAILRNAEAAEIILRNEQPPLDEIACIVEDIIRDDLRAGSVIDRLRSLLKKGAIDIQPINLAETIKEVITLVHGDAQARHVAIDFTQPDVLPDVGGDRIHLQQVLINLLVNAMDALDANPVGNRSIRVAVRESGASRVEIRVCDNGPGIPDGQMEKLFAPFFTTKSTGMGMGLPVSKTIIEAHKGTLRAENIVAGGACFIIELPIV